MWISKKRWKALVKRVADLEGQVQSQHSTVNEIANEIIKYYERMTMTGSTFEQC
jgi:uncharacterized coiled-coil DUF342 family protein